VGRGETLINDGKADRLAGCQLAPETRQREKLAAGKMAMTGAQGDKANRDPRNGVSRKEPRKKESFVQRAFTAIITPKSGHNQVKSASPTHL
jgi:hypothetical protein